MLDSKKVAVELGARFANELGYDQRCAGVYSSAAKYFATWFFYEARVNRGVLEFTPCVGVEISSLDALVALVPGLERGNIPTLGGPLFRFVDLSKRNLHDFIVKTSGMNDVFGSLGQLRTLWREVAQPFLAQHRTSVGWLQAADGFLSGGRLGALNIPTAGRTSVALVYAARGSDAARDAVQRLSVLGPQGKPFQDYEEARRLFGLLCESPALLSELRLAIIQSGDA